jgi:hypothetical protein
MTVPFGKAKTGGFAVFVTGKAPVFLDNLPRGTALARSGAKAEVCGKINPSFRGSRSVNPE